MLQELGAEVREVQLESLQHADLLRVTTAAEAYVVHEPYLTDHHDDYSPGLFYRYLGAAFIPAADYIKSLKLQRIVQEDFAQTLQEVDVVATPTSPAAAPLIGSSPVTIGAANYTVAPPGVIIGIRNTHISNATGLPSISVPCGFNAAGLPTGLQLIGRPFEEPLLYRIASLYEQVSPSVGRFPPIADQQPG